MIEGKSVTQTIGSSTYLVDRSQLLVPQLWSTCSASKFNLPIVRFKNSRGSQTSTLFFLNGGPGTSNLTINAVPRFLRDHFDVILVGYRGVDTEPSIQFSRFKRALGTYSFLRGGNSSKRLIRSFDREISRLERLSLKPEMFSANQVVEDLEFARSKLGIDRALVYGISFGTRLAYLWSAKYPSGISRVVQEAVNPPGRFVWESADINETWKAIDCMWEEFPHPRPAHLVPSQLVLEVLRNMPRRWGLLELDRGRIESMVFGLLFDIDNLSNVVSLFLAAREGKYAGLAGLSSLFPLVIKRVIESAGDFYFKGLIDFDRFRDYSGTLVSEDEFSSYYSLAIWSWVSKCKVIDVGVCPGKLRVDVPTLLVSGDLDLSTPMKYARKEMLPLCTKATTLTVKNAGHTNIVEENNAALTIQVLGFLSGEVVKDNVLNRVPRIPGKVNLGSIGYIFQILAVLSWLTPIVVGAILFALLVKIA